LTALTKLSFYFQPDCCAAYTESAEYKANLRIIGRKLEEMRS